jgi:hypothetical protein
MPLLPAILLCSALAAAGPDDTADQAALARSLTFHASFDRGIDADFAKGDAKLYSTAGARRSNAKPGLPSNVTLAKGQGKFGDCLQFTRKAPTYPFFQGQGNISYEEKDWSFTLSFWLALDPDKELAPGFCDPLQATDKDWNDSCVFVEFNRDQPRHFRLGVFPDFKTWNPKQTKWEAMPLAERERQFVDVGGGHFASDRWTHIVVTADRFNAAGDGVATLYLDGKEVGRQTRPQTFRWNPSRSALLLGLSYIGRYDEIAVFDRALTAAEVRTLHSLPQGVQSLRNR